MPKVISKILFAAIFLANVGCRNNVHPADYVHFVNSRENGFKKISQIDGWEFCIQYKPYDYIMLMENKGHLKGYDLEKRRSELQGTAWFNIDIKRVDNAMSPLRYGISNIEEYNRRLNYFLNEAEKDIKLVYGKQTLQPVSYVFENNYNLSPKETIVVGFFLPKGENQPEKDMRISFVDRVFKNGIINAEYTGKILKSIPTLIY